MRRTKSLCHSGVSVLCLALLIGLSGCGGGDPNKGINVKTTFPATGKILVDGKSPSEFEDMPPIQIKAWPQGEGVSDQPPGRAGSKPDGAFELTTYNAGDGLPVGEYKLTFKSTKVNLLNPGMAAADHLGAQYLDPDKSNFTVTVSESGEVQGLESIDLKKAARPVILEDDRN